MRRLLYDYRMEADPNAYAMMSLFVDRGTVAPSVAMQFMAHLWSQERMRWCSRSTTRAHLPPGEA